MHVVIDADGCPVVRIAVDCALRHVAEAIIVCDSAHYFDIEGAKTITVTKGADSADFRIVNMLHAGDIVVTQDYGLAALVLGKGGKALNQNGLIYSDTNIENLLFTRYIGKKERMAGNRTKGPKKRTAQNDAEFIKAFILCLDSN